MLNWLRSLINRVSGAEQRLWNDIINVIMAVQGYDEAWITQTWNFAQALLSDIRSVINFINSFIGNTYNPFSRWVQQQIFSINVREHEDYSQIGADIAALQSRTNQQVTIVQQNLSDGLSGIIKWILSHIFGPLSSDIAKILSWIAHEGAFMLDLLLHADKLLLYLLKFLGSQWQSLAGTYGKVVIRWFMANMRMLAPEIISVIEDIITSVL